MENTEDPSGPTAEELREAAGPLVEHEDILAVVSEHARSAGFAGPTTSVKLIVLALITREFAHPVSVALLGPSSAGKSFTVKAALAFLPPEAYLPLTGMSDKALVYMDEPLEHRFLIIYETAGLTGEFLSYGIRTLLSEGRLDYQYTDFKRKTVVRVEKDGPTGLITSTAGGLDRELATRVIGPTVRDDETLTRAILLAAAQEESDPFDYTAHHALHRWIATQPTRVVIPFAQRLAEETNASAVRMRRDFPAVLGLIRAHALLHQATRERDVEGRVLAVPADYAAVHGLVADMVAEGAERAVPEIVRETAEAVKKLFYSPGGSSRAVGIQAVAKHLGITRTAASRRINRAIGMGYVNETATTSKGRAKLVEPGDPMPEDAGVLPDPAVLS